MSAIRGRRDAHLVPALLGLLAAGGCRDRDREAAPTGEAGRPPATAPSAPATAPSAPATATRPITAATGPIELLAADGAPLRTLLVGGAPVAWRLDGDTTQGLRLVYDANGNGDLADDAPHVFTRAGTAWDLALTLAAPSALGDGFVEAPVRLRVRADAAGQRGSGGDAGRGSRGDAGRGSASAPTVRVQRAIVRRGSLALPRGAMAFALIGDDGQFGQDHQFVAFDLDRDGRLDLEALDGPELFHVFEKAVTLDGQSYAFAIGLDGAALTLRPLAEPLPPRAPLAVGTRAPDIAVTDLDGTRTSLAALRGKVVLIDFWATSCAPCIRALPELAALRARYADRGFEILSIAAEADDVREKLAGQHTGIVAIDEAAQSTYRVDRFPTYFLVARDGTIACSRCRLDTIAARLDALLR